MKIGVTNKDHTEIISQLYEKKLSELQLKLKQNKEQYETDINSLSKEIKATDEKFSKILKENENKWRDEKEVFASNINKELSKNSSLEKKIAELLEKESRWTEVQKEFESTEIKYKDLNLVNTKCQAEVERLSIENEQLREYKTRIQELESQSV